MILPVTELVKTLHDFMWPFMRVSALVLAAPVFGTRLVPVRVRIVMAVVLTWVVVPLLPAAPTLDALSIPALLLMAQQVMIGLAMGFSLQLIFNALIIAGENMAMSMGLGFASMIDPQNGVNVPVLSQFFVIVATLIFLSLNGHLAVIALLVKSFELMPIKGVGLTREAYWTVASWASEMLIGAVRIALPVVVSILIAYLALGVMTRAAPQLNVFSVGFPVILLFGFVLLALTMPSFLPAFAELFDGGIELIDTLFSVSR